MMRIIKSKFHSGIIFYENDNYPYPNRTDGPKIIWKNNSFSYITFNDYMIFSNGTRTDVILKNQI